jgi:hypothetical protein
MIQATWYVSYTNYPPDTDIHLGQLLSTDPRKPAEYLGPGTLILAESPMKLEETHEEDVKFTKEISRTAGLGFSASFKLTPICECFKPLGIAGDTTHGTGFKWEIQTVNENQSPICVAAKRLSARRSWLLGALILS